jgi:co-chaperonin GroES (HSP10)
LFDAAGPLTDYEVFHNSVLVATYIPPERTKGGIILSDRSLAESRYQGKVFLVLKIGPLAFKDDSAAKFGGITIEVGDWVVFRPSDGSEMFIKDHTGTSNDGLSCRWIEDVLIKGRVRDPSLIY